MKRTIIYLILFLFICSSSDSALKYSIGSEIDNQSPYYLSFASIGANLLESRLDCWAKIKTVSNSEEMNQYLLMILSHLNLPADKNDFLHQENDEISLIQYDLNYNNQNYYFMLQTNKMEKDSHFLMTVISNENDQKLRQDESKLRELFDCKSYYQFKGSIDARPDYAGQEELLHILMENLRADTKNIYRDTQIISATGFSSTLSLKIPPVYVAGNQCNVQAAIRRNNQDNKTEIYLGFPLLLNDY
jgi:hypothetical protein